MAGCGKRITYPREPYIEPPVSSPTASPNLCTPANMCKSHTIYHLCGHPKIKTLVQCAEMIEKLMASDLPLPGSRLLCDDVNDNPHVFPAICPRCQKNGVIGEWMQQQPGAKVNALRAWKAQAPTDAQRDSAIDFPTSSDSGESDRVSDLETSERVPALENASSSTSAATTVASTSSTVGQKSAASLKGETGDLGAIKARISVLKARTERLLTKIQAFQAN